MQLISYIAPGAPATRRPGSGNEPFLRTEIGFTPKWYREKLGVDFGRRWHTDVAYRRETVSAMRSELRSRFPESSIGGIDRPESPLDLLTGVFGAVSVASIHGVETVFAEDNWPNCRHQHLSDDDLDELRPPDLDSNAFFASLMSQVDEIAALEGRVEGYINWQGILNNAHRLRGEALFMDMMCDIKRCHHLFDCVCITMVDAAKRLHERQRATGVEVGFFTVSNCLVNMVSPEQYRELIFPYDRRIAEAFGCIGVHNCAWNADPYMECYAELPGLGYVDMGIESNLRRARDLFPHARRAIMYTPMDVANKSVAAIEGDMRRIAEEYGPCDIVAADIESDTPDEKVRELIRICAELSERG